MSPDPTGTAVLRLDEVYRTHGTDETEVQALRGVSLAVYAGELVAGDPQRLTARRPRVQHPE